jgi:DNA-binding CsgD family transcriptional regulator
MIHAIDGVPRAAVPRVQTFLTDASFCILEEALTALRNRDEITIDATAAWQSGRIRELRQADVFLVDADFGGIECGWALVDTMLRETRASVVFLCREHEMRDEVIASPRCFLLHLPLSGSQLRMTVRQALARRSEDARWRRVPALPLPTAEEMSSRHVPALSGVEETGVEGGLARIEIDRLRPREQQIVKLLLQHYRVPAIAVALGISASTVRNHLKNIYRRFALHSQDELLRRVDARRPRLLHLERE